MYKHINILLILISFCLLSTNCSSNNDNELNNVPLPPLTSFAVKVGTIRYHGSIDQETRKVTIGSIENPYVITDVEYTLVNDEATISPDPNTFLGKWKQKQEVTVTTKNGTETIYTIELPDYKEESGDIIFYDDFDTDGPLDRKKWVPIYFERKKGEAINKWVESNDYCYAENGNLVLKADIDGNIYKLGRVQTLGKFCFTFGKVEIRARVTRHPDGNFPAIWMMPEKPIYPPSGINTNPISGEIDIMEHVKQENCIHQTVHSNYTFNLEIKDPINTTNVVCDYENYNLYGMEWNADEIIFYVNGVETLRYPNLRLPNESEVMQWPFSEKSAFYLILNMSLGDTGSWAGAVDDANLPAIMEVDYVKVSKPQKESEH